jgi:hypothetical protein
LTGRKGRERKRATTISTSSIGHFCDMPDITSIACEMALGS